MSSEWPLHQIEAVAERVGMGPFGSSIKVETFVDSGIPIISGEHLHDVSITEARFRFITPKHADRLVKSNVFRGDVVFTHAGTIGQVSVIPANSRFERYALSQRQFFLRCRREILNPHYVAYYFKTPEGRHKLLANASQVGVPSIARPVTYLRSIQLPVPPLAAQNAIVAHIEALRRRIALLRETNATLEAIAQALFKSWFVDFDPVSAKQQGLPPADMDEATAALFPDSFEASDLGPMPTGWKVQPIGDVVECVGGATPDTKDSSFWLPEDHAWTTPKDLSGLSAPVLLKTERRLSARGIAKIGSGILPSGTLLLSSRAPIGYLAITQMAVAINQGYIAMPPGSQLPPLYMLFWCRHNMESIKARANGSTFMEISKKAFRPLPALVPSKLAIEAFMAVAVPLFDRLVANERQAQILASLRDTLLPRLISGQLRLPEAEALAVG